MRMLNKDGSDLMKVDSIELSGVNILVRGKVMGTMPMVAILPPSEARKAFGLLSWKLVGFVLTLPFRKDKK